ncbi:MAG TPA: FAD/NAD(P)-binding protein, partial [Candidatus Methylacidiphilales bacterium]
MPLSVPTRPLFDVVILGGGFSGAATAMQLLQPSESAGETLRIALVDADGSFGPGIAYGKGAGEGLLNVSAAVMGAFPDAPGDFLRWAQERAAATGTAIPAPTAFVQRKTYGLYLKDLLRKAAQASPHAFETIRGRGTDLVPLPDGTLSIALDGGRFLYAGKVVLAVGNFPPQPPKEDGACRDHAGYIAEPWEEEVVAQLAMPGDVLIVGTGLTCLDFLCALDGRKKEGTIHVLSRRGLFPLPHPPASVPFRNEGPIEPGPLRELLRAVREKIAAGAFWRDVIDSLRPQTQALWKQLSVADK